MKQRPRDRLGALTKGFVSSVHRELRIALTPVPKPIRWIFLVGCYNSGTTLLADLLGRHPAIHAVPKEGQFLTRELVRDFDVGLPRMWVGREELFRLDEGSTGPDVDRIKKQWGMRAGLRASVIMEKSPPNAARTRWLQAHFAPAYFIGIVRNGYAVAEGIRRKAEPKHQPGGRWPIDRTAHQWARSNEVLVSDSHALQRFAWVTYENLTSDPEAQLRRLLEFTQLPWDSSVLGTGDLNIHEHSGPIQDLNADSISRLSARDIEEINRVAAPMLHHFQYEVIDPQATRETSPQSNE